MVLIQLIFYSLSVLLVCLQNQVYGSATNQFFFVKSKSIIDRNIFSCYQLIPSSSDVFVVEGFQTKPNIGKSSVCFFSFLTGEHSSARVLRVESFLHRQYYCIFAHSDLKATKQKFFDVKTF